VAGAGAGAAAVAVAEFVVEVPLSMVH
jgi:hypothetical protein